MEAKDREKKRLARADKAALKKAAKKQAKKETAATAAAKKAAKELKTRDLTQAEKDRAARKKAAAAKRPKPRSPAQVKKDKAEAAKRHNPKHEPADSGFNPALYPLLSTIQRALLTEGVIEPHGRRKKGAPKRAFDLGQIMTLLATWGPLIQALVASLTKPAAPVVAPPSTVTPSPVPNPNETPSPVHPQPAPVAVVRRIAGGKTHGLGVEGWSPTKKHYSLGGGTVRNIFSGQEFCGAGYRIHLDTTPVDQFGKPFYNEDLHNFPHLFAQDPSLVVQTKWGGWTCGEGNNRLHHFVTVDGREYGPMGDMVEGMAWQEQDVVDLTSETDDAACTVVLVVPQDIELSQEHTVSYRAEHVAADGTVTRFDPSPEFRVKAWGF